MRNELNKIFDAICQSLSAYARAKAVGRELDRLWAEVETRERTALQNGTESGTKA